MALGPRHALIRDPVPDYLPSGLVQTVDVPGMLRDISGRVDITIKSGPENRFRVAADRRSYKDPVSPNDRAGVRESWNRRLPQNILVLLSIPGDRQSFAVRYSGRIRASKRWPVLRNRRHGPD